MSAPPHHKRPRAGKINVIDGAVTSRRHSADTGRARPRRRRRAAVCCMQRLLARLQPLRPGPQQLRATLAASAAAAMARRLEVLEQAVVLQEHAGRRLDSVLPELFRERFAASGASATGVCMCRVSDASAPPASAPQDSRRDAPAHGSISTPPSSAPDCRARRHVQLSSVRCGARRCASMAQRRAPT